MTASVLTNTSAMIALQTLRDTNASLREVNNQISTGKEIATAKDNASLFAISEVMEADVAGFQAVSDSLALGQSSLGVASNAAETIGDLLNEIKGKIVAANEDNVDRQKLQDEITSLVNQVQGTVDAAQFNGLNLIDGSTTSFSVLSSLNRDSAGTVTTANVSLNTTNTNLSTQSGTDVSAAAGTDNVGAGVTLAVADATGGSGPDFADIGAFSFLDNSGGATGTTALDRNTAGADTTATGGLIEGDVVSITIGNVSASYAVREGDAEVDVATGIRQALVDAGIDQTQISLTIDATNGNLDIENLSATNTVDVSRTITRGAGALAGLGTIDVTSAPGAAAALTTIETLTQTAVDAQAAIGTTESRLEIQRDFMSSLIDSFEAGIGSLVDADLEEASARLQALQVQQQLGTQALSIANQQPQNLLALFR